MMDVPNSAIVRQMKCWTRVFAKHYCTPLWDCTVLRVVVVFLLVAKILCSAIRIREEAFLMQLEEEGMY